MLVLMLLCSLSERCTGLASEGVQTPVTELLGLDSVTDNAFSSSSSLQLARSCHKIPKKLLFLPKRKIITSSITGNICRSTMAEGVFKNLVQQQGVADQVSFFFFFF